MYKYCWPSGGINIQILHDVGQEEFNVKTINGVG